jgi:hypothetical protein
MNNKSAVLIAKRNLEFLRMRDSGKKVSIKAKTARVHILRCD